MLHASARPGGLALASCTKWAQLRALCPHATFGLPNARARAESVSAPASMERCSTQFIGIGATPRARGCPGRDQGATAAPAAAHLRPAPSRTVLVAPAAALPRNARWQPTPDGDRDTEFENDVGGDFGGARYDGGSGYGGRGGGGGGGSSSSSSGARRGVAGGSGGGGTWRSRRTASGRPYSLGNDDDNHDGGDDEDDEGGASSGGQQRTWRRSVPPTAAGPPLSRSRRVALLRKPALTAADKTALPPEERRRIFWALRTPRGARPAPAPASSTSARARPPPPSAPPLLRVFCHGIDDVRLYRALSEAGALGRVVVAASVAEADAVLATRIKRTGRAVSMDLVTRSARKAGKPLLELPAVSAVRVMEAVEALTGWPVPPHLRRSPQAPGGVAYLTALEPGTDGAAEALALMTGGMTSVAEYLVHRAGEGGGALAASAVPAAAAAVVAVVASATGRAAHPAPELVAELDAADVYDSREAERPANPQQREASRQPALSRPHMPGSRQERMRLRRELQRRAAEEAGLVDW